MKFQVSKDEFNKAVSSVDGIISNRELKSVLSNIKIECSKESVTLTATDLEISIRNIVPSKVTKEGKTSIPAKILSNFLKTIRYKDILFETEGVDNQIIVIKDAEGKDNSAIKINTMIADEIRAFPSIDKKQVFDFDSVTLNEMINKTYYAVAQEDTRFVFNGLFFKNLENSLSLVGTDGRRLAKISRITEKNYPFEKGIIVPHKAVRQIQKMVDANLYGSIGLIDGQLYIQLGHTEMLCKLIDGNYPDYEQVIPKNTSNKVLVSKDEFTHSLRGALSSAEEPSRNIKITIVDNTMKFYSVIPGITEFNCDIQCIYNGEEIVLAFKGDYLSDMIKAIHSAELQIDFTNQNSPVVFRNADDQDFISIIMPMKF